MKRCITCSLYGNPQINFGPHKAPYHAEHMSQFLEIVARSVLIVMCF